MTRKHLNLYFGGVLLFVFQTGCVSTGMWSGYSKTTMVRVQHTRNYAPIGSKDFLVEDKNISIKYEPDIVEAGNNIQITNKSNKPVKIIWDDSVYISPSNTTEKIFHAGVKLIDRAQSQPSSIIPPTSMIQDTIIPINSANFGSTGWEYIPLCGIKSLAMHTLDDEQCLNKEFSFFITYESEGKRNNLSYKYKYISKEPINSIKK